MESLSLVKKETQTGDFADGDLKIQQSRMPEEAVVSEKKQQVVQIHDHFELNPEFFNALEKKEKEKEKETHPIFFLMDPKTRDQYIADGEYDIKKITQKIEAIARSENNTESTEKKNLTLDHKKSFEKNNPEIRKIVRKNDILEGQKNFYQKLLWKVHECAALYQSNTLDQVRIFSSGGRIVIEDLTLVQKEQQKRFDLEMIRKEQDMCLEAIAVKKKGYFQSEEGYKRELASLDAKNTVFKQREEYILKGLHGEHGVLTKRVAIETTVAYVLQQLIALGQHIPERFSREPITLETILKHAEQFLQLYIAHTELPEEERELLEQYQRIETSSHA